MVFFLPVVVVRLELDSGDGMVCSVNSFGDAYNVVVIVVIMVLFLLVVD